MALLQSRFSEILFHCSATTYEACQTTGLRACVVNIYTARAILTTTLTWTLGRERLIGIGAKGAPVVRPFHPATEHDRLTRVSGRLLLPACPSAAMELKDMVSRRPVDDSVASEGDESDACHKMAIASLSWPRDTGLRRV